MINFYSVQFHGVRFDLSPKGWLFLAALFPISCLFVNVFCFFGIVTVLVVVVYQDRTKFREMIKLKLKERFRFGSQSVRCQNRRVQWEMLSHDVV